MPDLINRPYSYCLSVTNYQTKIDSHTVTHGKSGGQYQYDWSCDCKGFKFRRKCKHVEAAKLSYCGWNEFTDGGSRQDGKCPKCSGEVSVMMVGV